jgi:DNA-binding MarR family transcriptional regulator
MESDLTLDDRYSALQRGLADLALSLPALRAFGYLVERADTTGVVLASLREIYAAIGVSRATSAQAIALLQVRGYIERIERTDPETGATLANRFRIIVRR